ncbi:DUF4129 domain-containing protein [Lentibacillus jeotgali]|uniref:DUF4129 domain-containing protein n=1 Tax=Lentibacillus jeotgali TaxID=558169 RepID=UPI0002625887|nr:DUF4129 domain-containing protein [Lentibacillus jeotgali]
MAKTDNKQKQLQEILDQNEYQIYYEDNRNLLEVWWGRLTNWIGEQLAKVFSGLEPSSGFADLVLIIIIAAVLILVGFVVYQRVRQTRSSRGFTEIKPLESLNETKWTYNDHLQAAQNQERTGDYTVAARHMFLALLLYSHEKEWLKARNWKTNWEYLAELKHVNKHLAESFRQLALVFDEVVYGERVLEQDDYIRYRNETMKWLYNERQEIVGEE